MYYFAYGSLLDDSEMKEICPGAKLVSTGCLKEHRLDFTRYSSKRWKGGVADVVISKDCEVWGIVYEITDSDLKRLDKREGYPEAYDRSMKSIETPDGTSFKAWVYTVNKKESFVPPTAKYMKIIRDASKKHDFPVSYQEYLAKIKVSR